MSNFNSNNSLIISYNTAYVATTTPGPTFSSINPSDINDMTNIDLTNFWVGSETQAMLNIGQSGRLNLQKDWEIWRSGTIFDYTDMYVYTNTLRNCSATLVSGSGSENNNMISIINNNYYTEYRPFVIKMNWNNIPSNQSTVNFRLRVTDDNSNSIEKPYTINLINKNISIACSSSTISNNINENLTLFLKDTSTNEILDPLLANWYLASGDGSVDNDKFDLNNNTEKAYCGLSLKNPSGITHGQTLNLRIKCILLSGATNRPESNIYYENQITLIADSGIVTNRHPYAGQESYIKIQSTSRDFANAYFAIEVYPPATYYINNLFYGIQIQTNNDEWQWLSRSTVPSGRFYVSTALSPSTYETVTSNTRIKHCDSIKFRTIYSFNAIPGSINAVSGNWIYSPQYTLLPNFGRTSNECNTPIVSLPIYSLFTSSEE